MAKRNVFERFGRKKIFPRKEKFYPLRCLSTWVRLSSFELIFESWLSFKSIRFSVHTAPYRFLLQNYYRSKLSKILFIYRYPTWDTRRIEILSNSRSLPLLFVFHSFLSIYLSFFFFNREPIVSGNVFTWCIFTRTGSTVQRLKSRYQRYGRILKSVISGTRETRGEKKNKNRSTKKYARVKAICAWCKNLSIRK